ncbi:SGNH/GDSL hydrolase family protein [Bacteriovorax stolpii]|uniref:SGNH/GDSL hydrolase family protein n=1 Tax=Bacteriovorax stolpii TaxID=960 RepID=UPI0011570F58|nr:SGNH/GDSL hydrolase family protein [Bacteriovorax stolpii]
MKKTITVISLSLILILVVNFSLKFILNWNKGEEVRKDPELGWDFANFKKKHFNDLGFRTLSTSEEIKNSNKELIVFLGNSVVAGGTLEYNQVFPYLINDYLPSDKYLVLNAGSEGYEIYREHLKYVRDYSKVSPKYVVWFPNTNDYQNKEDIFRNFVETAEAQGRSEAFPKNLIGGFNLLAARIQHEKELITERFLWSPKNQYYTSPLLNSLSLSSSEALKKELKDFNSFLNANGTQLIAVFLPPHYFCKFYKWEDAKSFQDLEKILNEMNIKSISMFDKLSCKDRAIYEDFVHFNNIGHVEIAQKLAPLLSAYLK